MFLALPSSAFCTRGSVGKLSATAVAMIESIAGSAAAGTRPCSRVDPFWATSGPPPRPLPSTQARRRASSSWLRGRRSHEEQRILLAGTESVIDEAAREWIGHPALAVDDEHVLVCSRRQNGCPVPDTVAVVVAQVDQATAPVVERADDFNRTGSGEMADEVRDALTLARGGNGTLLPGQQQNRGKSGHQGQRLDWTQSEGDGPWTPEPPDHATYAIVREHVNRHLADLRRDAIRDAQPRRRLEQLGRRNQPGVRLPQIRRQLGRITLAIERFLQPWINWVHRTTSSSASSNASRARCTRILSVGIRAPVTAAISS